MSQIDTTQDIASITQSGRYLCPECAHERKKRNPTLVVTVESDRTLFDCHHCGHAGMLPAKNLLDKYRTTKKKEKVTPIPTKLNADEQAIRKFFRDRGIKFDNKTSLDLSSFPVITGSKFFPALNEETPAIGFLYGNGEKPEGIKWRPLDGRKAFVQDGAAKSLYGLNLLGDRPEEVLIVEGEADVIALASIGVKSVSVPNGACLKKTNRVDPEDDKKFAYLWKAKDVLGKASKIIIGTDNDQPGDVLADEIARRTGRGKCWRVRFPVEFKDATDVIAQRSSQTMLELLVNAEPMPLRGVYNAKSYTQQVNEIYREGLGSGLPTGIDVVDQLFTIKEGLLYLVTGYPGSGKSEFVDQLMVNLALNHSWKWAVASFENPPVTHIAKLAEKIVGKPFFRGLTPRMRKADLDESLGFIDEHFVFLEEKSGGMATIDSILDRTQQAILRLGVRGMVIDPYNYIDIDKTQNEHKAIEEMLTKVKAFIMANDIACFFVAHPQKLSPNQSGEMPVPRGHHVSGSAGWFNKPDVGITVHRGEIGVEIHCWKQRFKWIGQVGDTVIGYDVPTGRYFEKSFFPSTTRSESTALNKSSTSRKPDWAEPDHEWDTEDGWGV